MKHRAEIHEEERPLAEPAAAGRHAEQADALLDAPEVLPEVPDSPDGLEVTTMAELEAIAHALAAPAIEPIEFLADDEEYAERPRMDVTTTEVLPEPEATDVVAAHHVPAHAEPPAEPVKLGTQGKWRQRNLMRSLIFLILIAAAALTGLTGRLFAEERSDVRMEHFILAAVFVAALWAILTATAPQTVTLQGSILCVKSRRGTDRFDLSDGMQVVEISGDPRRKGWSVSLQRNDCSVVRLGRRDVDARTLDPIIRRHREVALARREQHWTRLLLDTVG